MVRQALKLKGIDHINFASSDMDRTIAFWEGIGVACQFRLKLHDPERYHFFFDAGGGSLFSYWYWPGRQVSPAQGQERDHAGFYHLAFQVESEEELDETHAHLKAAGIPISEITGRHMFDKSFYFKDPDGLQFEFACQVLRLEGDIDHDGNGTLTPLSTDAKLGKRRLDGPVHFDTLYK
jgi:catechol 2,3-dioxygenase-like lactoylglutathione lyase family enzyme